MPAEGSDKEGCKKCNEEGGGVDPTSKHPVRYFNGELQLAVTDMQAMGADGPWAQRRQYSNQLQGQNEVGLGYNWLVEAWPYLLKGPDGAIAFVRSTRNAMWFDRVESGGDVSFAARYGGKSTLTHDCDSRRYSLAQPSGEIWFFKDFGDEPCGSTSSSSASGTQPLPGQLTGMIDVSGQQTDVVAYSASGRIQTIQRETVVGSDTTTTQFEYEFNGMGLTTAVTYRRQVNTDGWVNIRRVTYEYYDGSNNFGSSGDLMRVRIQEPSGATWVNVKQSYYRYYKTADPKGFEHGLRYVVESDGYEDLLADSLDPTTASNTVLLQYSKYCFEYDAQHRVTKEIVDRGSLTYTFAYEQSLNVDGYNHWSRKTTETRPGGSVNTVYTNFIGQGLLSVLTSGSDQWLTANAYDDAGRLLQVALPSAVISFDPGEADLGIVLRSTEGLIKLRSYYATTGSGAATGYLESTSLKQGSGGTPVLQSELEYTQRTGGGATIYPIAKQTRYRDDAGAEPLDTTYTYEWYTDAVQIKQRTITLPVVTTAQNGPNTATTQKQVYDERGNLTWSMDARGFITRMFYDQVLGAMLQRIDDADTSLLSGVPAGWSTPSVGGKHLIFDYEIDSRGRTTQQLGPVHTLDIGGTATAVRRASWTVYKDAEHATWTASGYATGTGPAYTYTLINPVNIQQRDARGNILEQIEVPRGSTSGRLQPTDTFSQASFTSWTTWQYTDCCLVSSTRAYHTIPASGEGTSGTNYDQTTYGYDSQKRQNLQFSPGGTISQRVYDVRDNVVAIYVGTNDTGSTESDPTGSGASGNNMVQVSGFVFDSGNDGGDNNLTSQIAYVDGVNTRTTAFTYDWRNRRVDTNGELDVFARVTYDNLNRVIQSDRYDTSTSGNLVSRNLTKHDNLGRVYQSVRYAVDPSTGSVGNPLTSNTWFDAVGNTVKSMPGGSSGFTKQVFDSTGWMTRSYVGYGNDTTYADALNVTGDVILSQTDLAYDNAGNTIQTSTRQRYHNAPASQTGVLGSPAATPNARVVYSASYPDALGRMIASAEYGTNGGTALTRSATIPSSSDTTLISQQVFDNAGRLRDTTDRAGKISRTIYDAASRQTEKIDNVVDPSTSSSTSTACTASDDQNQTVQFTYTPDGDLKTLTAVNAVTGNQVTQYIYGTTLSDSAIASSGLLRREIYPDSTGPSDSVSYTYNRQSQRTSLTDQNGSTRQYDFDSLGRQKQDRVTTLGAGVDGTIRRVEQTYDVRGNVSAVTCYNNASVGSGSIVNQITRQFDGFGQVTNTFQSHSGAVNPASTPSVGRSYTDGSGNVLRPITTLYPNGREVTLDYGSSGSITDKLNQVSSLIDDDSTVLAAYQYLGLSTFVQQDSTQADLRYTLISPTLATDPDTGDIYSGLDRFSRVTDVRWRDISAATDLSRIEYGYDRASNRTWRENPSDPNREHDWLYKYDGLDRLQSAQRGQLNGTHTAITTLDAAQCWTLDPTGNWKEFRQDKNGDGTWDFNQTRTANQVNEITDISNAPSDIWATPVYDKNGNTTTNPRPDLGTNATMTATFDAWNRMTKLVDGSSSNVLLENLYDGRNFRIVAKEYTSGTLARTREYYFTDAWQCVEEHVDTSNTPHRQYVWGMRYIDDLVLRDRDISPSGGLLTERLYYLADANWNTTAVVSDSGSVQERYEYDPYGNLSVFEANFTPRAVSSYAVHYTYTSREWTPDAGLYYFRNRWYDAQLGRFSSRDPIGYEGSPWNLHEYAGGSPTKNVDPSGKSIERPSQLDNCLSKAADDRELLFSTAANSVARQLCNCHSAYKDCLSYNIGAEELSEIFPDEDLELRNCELEYLTCAQAVAARLATGMQFAEQWYQGQVTNCHNQFGP
ncbi:RHS repeat-associated core domain-containing protein [Allorhodopirellula solitaria]|uniref:tRNA nuclease WapA n=1 Tax=Allorhodopirellula solitaria TaxID=2527987 RepID=A0A5C5WZ06_9BACT|nr:RHS repeat-associated core domain-containing protein [Allorhodopirellula solitaria]TWT55957.1 tRNA nuclease WapA precursor [Allorhodopirellula solitaria]